MEEKTRKKKGSKGKKTKKKMKKKKEIRRKKKREGGCGGGRWGKKRRTMPVVQNGYHRFVFHEKVWQLYSQVLWNWSGGQKKMWELQVSTFFFTY
jgi:hypothetical protein